MLLGSTLDGRYLLEEEIGAGGMGTVFRARDLTRDALVAIKILHPGHAGDAERAAREAETLARLDVRGVVRYLGHGVLAGTTYLVTEWIPGGTLSERLQREGLSPAEAVRVVRQVAEALAPVHAAGVVHRDVKPSNVMLRGGDVDAVSVIDFGLAWRAELSRLTRTGTMIGTPGYMAPEQVRGERGLDARIDVFALGCMLYECLAGRPAFMGDGITSVQAKILLAAPPPVDELTGALPAALTALLTRMLAKDPRQRPRDAGEVAAGLAAVGPIPDGPRRPRKDGFWVEEKQRLDRTEVSLTTPTAELFWIVLALSDDDEVEVTPPDAAVERLGDGTLLAAPASSGTPAERAEAAALLALSLGELMPDAPVVAVSAAGDREAPRVLESAIERGVRSLEAAAVASLAGGAQVTVDERTAGLLGDRFEVAPAAGGLFSLRRLAGPSGALPAG